jgi:hypothetical protein
MCDKSLFISFDCGRNVTLIATPADKGCTHEGKTINLEGVTSGRGPFNCNIKSDVTWIPLSTDKYLGKACPIDPLCKEYGGEVHIFNGTEGDNSSMPTPAHSTGKNPTPSSTTGASSISGTASSSTTGSSSQTTTKGSNGSQIGSAKSTLIKLGVFGLIFSSLVF